MEGGRLERLYLLAFLLTGERVELWSQAALRDSRLKIGQIFFFTVVMDGHNLQMYAILQRPAR